MAKNQSMFDKKTRAQIIKDIDAAAMKLKRVGWTQGTEVEYQTDDFGNETDKPLAFCAIGALGEVGACPQAERALSEFVQRLTATDPDTGRNLTRSKYAGLDLGSIVDFNDEAAETRRDVLDIFRRTQRALRSRTL